MTPRVSRTLTPSLMRVRDNIIILIIRGAHFPCYTPIAVQSRYVRV